MNRRGFFSATVGGLVLGPVSKVIDLDVLVRSQVFPEVGIWVPVDLATQFDFEKLWLEQIRIICKQFSHLTLEMNHTTSAMMSLRKDIMSSPVFVDTDWEDDV